MAHVEQEQPLIALAVGVSVADHPCPVRGKLLMPVNNKQVGRQHRRLAGAHVEDEMATAASSAAPAGDRFFLASGRRSARGGPLDSG